MPLADAWGALLATVATTPAVERVPTFEADGRVLAEPVVAGLDVPGHDNSSMDGYAVRVADVVPGVAMPVSQRIAAGQFGSPLQPGSAARLFTGAPVPPGADAVVMQEMGAASLAADGTPQVVFDAVPPTGAWIRRLGEDVQRGAVVLAAGTRLGPAELGLAASLGHADLPVHARLRVALLSTGDELVMPGTCAPEALPPGAIFNSNRFFLRALLARLGCVVTDLG
ncbi:MAG: hypothetical protein RJA09_492, partial [Pseudomonadota bacterium]